MNNQENTNKNLVQDISKQADENQVQASKQPVAATQDKTTAKPVTKDKAKGGTQKQIKQPEYSFKLMFVVVEKGFADTVAQIFAEYQTNNYLMLSGMGTANTQLLALLGLGDSSKDVAVSIVQADKTEHIIQQIKAQIRSTGVVFTVRLNSIGGRKIIHLLRGESDGTN